MHRRLLIVCPHFPPTNAPDHHRARIVAPELARLGWKVDILAIEPSICHQETDDWLLLQLPSSVEVFRVSGLGLRWCRLPLLGSNGVRAFLPMAFRAVLLACRRRYSATLFSGSVPESLLLIPILRTIGTSTILIDVQDPLITNEYAKNSITPPGGRFKFGLSQTLGRIIERITYPLSSAFLTVSENYIHEASQRTPIASIPYHTLPFPVDLAALSVAPANLPGQEIVTDDPAIQRWVYAGAIIPSMRLAIAGLFKALGSLNPQTRSQIRMYFIGTQYRVTDQLQESIIDELAKEFDVADLVTEVKSRVPYSHCLSCWNSASAVLALGSTDPAYNPSKIMGLMATGKPVLAIYDRASPVQKLIRGVSHVTSIEFTVDTPVSDVADAIRRKWLTTRAYSKDQVDSETALCGLPARNTPKGQAMLIDKIITDRLSSM